MDASWGPFEAIFRFKTHQKIRSHFEALPGDMFLPPGRPQVKKYGFTEGKLWFMKIDPFAPEALRGRFSEQKRNQNGAKMPPEIDEKCI